MLLTRLIATAGAVDPPDMRGHVAVVIDVLRASSTIVAALGAGARCVRPVADLSVARDLADGPGTLLCGERRGVRPAGFALGNSPGEYTPDVVGGKTIILTTTNGTLAIERCAEAIAVIVCACVNLSAVVRWLVRRGDPAIVVCAGSPGGPSFEDTLCAGILAHELGGKGPGLAEARARAAETPHVGRALRDCRHGRYLAGLGLADDVDWCAQRDVSHLVPVRGADGTMVAQGWIGHRPVVE